MDWLSGIGDWFSNLFSGNSSAPAPEVNTPTPESTWGYSFLPSGGDTAGGETGAGSGGTQLGAGTPDTGGSWWNNLFGNSTPSADSGSGSNWFSSLTGGLSSLGGIAKAVQPLAQLGATGLGAVASIQNMQKSAAAQKRAEALQQQIKSYATPMANQGQEISQAGGRALLGDQLPPGLQAQVDQYKAALLGRLRDQYARAGVDVSTMLPQMEQYANQQAMAFAAQLASNLYQQGGSAVSAGIAPLGNLANAELNQSVRGQNTASNASENIFKILGAS